MSKKKVKSGFAGQLQREREKAGLSAYRLSQLIGLSRQSVSALETEGGSSPNWRTVQLIALALGVDVHTFLDANLKLPDAPQAKGVGRPVKGG